MAVPDLLEGNRRAFVHADLAYVGNRHRRLPVLNVAETLIPSSMARKTADRA